MLVNAKLTHYHKVFNKQSRIDEWVRHNYDNIHLVGGKGSSLNKGLADANDVKIRIWYSLNDVDIKNFSIGDILVNGHIEQGITAQSDLKDYDTYNITSIVDNNYGVTDDIKHIHLEGK